MDWCWILLQQVFFSNRRIPCQTSSGAWRDLKKQLRLEALCVKQSEVTNIKIYLLTSMTIASLCIGLLKGEIEYLMLELVHLEAHWRWNVMISRWCCSHEVASARRHTATSALSPSSLIASHTSNDFYASDCLMSRIRRLASLGASLELYDIKLTTWMNEGPEEHSHSQQSYSIIIASINFLVLPVLIGR